MNHPYRMMLGGRRNPNIMAGEHASLALIAR
jgi:hypothetical protein